MTYGIGAYGTGIYGGAMAPAVPGSASSLSSAAGAWRDLALDPDTGDLLIHGGDFVLIQGADAIAQQCRLALGLWQGEFAFDTAQGMDWKTLLNDKTVSDARITAEVRRVLTALDGVQSVDSVTIDRNRTTRAATMTVTLHADTGAVLTVSAPVGV